MEPLTKYWLAHYWGLVGKGAWGCEGSEGEEVVVSKGMRERGGSLPA